MQTRKDEHEALKDAVEMAVLSMVHHPHIVHLYSCLTDMVEVPVTGAACCAVLTVLCLLPEVGCCFVHA